MLTDQDLQTDAAGRVGGGGGVSLPPLPPVVSAPSVEARSSSIDALGMLVVVVVATLLPEVEDASLARPGKHGGVAARRRGGGWVRGGQATTDRFLFPLSCSVEERCV